jgi:hypothetical protein
MGLMSVHPGTWHDQKHLRSVDYWRRHGVGEEACMACSGSGRYDHHGSPACSSCDGRGRKRAKLHTAEQALDEIEAVARRRRNHVEVRRALREGRKPNVEVTLIRILELPAKKSP